MQEEFSEVVIILIASTFLILLLGSLIVIALLIQQKRKYKHRQQIIEMKREYETEILQTQLEIQEQTFKAISQNLHDSIASDISTAMLLLHPQPHISREISDQNKKMALQTLDKVIDDMKNLARYMNPSYLDAIGLQEAIKRQLSLINQLDGVNTHLVAEEKIVPISPEQQLVYFRIFQECITNAIHHGKAHNITIKITDSDGRFSMRFRDDGIGFETESKVDVGGSTIGTGIINMRERARLIGASFELKSRPGEGTEVIVSLPITLND